MDWSEVVWLIYESPKGIRAEAPRKLHAPRGSKAHDKGYHTFRSLRPNELRPDERLVGTVHGVSRRTALARARAGKITAAA